MREREGEKEEKIEREKMGKSLLLGISNIIPHSHFPTLTYFGFAL